ncbi:unnamed protein product [Chrysoparadoxa australica]
MSDCDSSEMMEWIDWEQTAVESCENWYATTLDAGFPDIKSSKGRLLVTPVQRLIDDATESANIVRILPGDGWGTGEHPTTKMCLDFIESNVRSGDRFLDYGTGSGVLSIAAVKMGAAHAVAVDIDDEILDHAQVNFDLNGVSDSVNKLHTRMVLAGEAKGTVVVANILIGALRRLLPVLCLSLEDEDSLLCLSGFRSSDKHVLQGEYGKFIEWDDDLESTGTHPVWGEWCMIVGKARVGMKGMLDQYLSDMAVS